jgi:hypothetical protein
MTFGWKYVTNESAILHDGINNLWVVQINMELYYKIPVLWKCYEDEGDSVLGCRACSLNAIALVMNTERTSECPSISTRLRGAISQKTVIFIPRENLKAHIVRDAAGCVGVLLKILSYTRTYQPNIRRMFLRIPMFISIYWSPFLQGCCCREHCLVSAARH